MSLSPTDLTTTRISGQDLRPAVLPDVQFSPHGITLVPRTIFEKPAGATAQPTQAQANASPGKPARQTNGLSAASTAVSAELAASQIRCTSADMGQASGLLLRLLDACLNARRTSLLLCRAG